MDDQTKKSVIGGAIIASAILLHIFMQKRTISMSRLLHSITGNEMDQSKYRFAMFLGLIGSAAYLQQNRSSLFQGESVVSGITIWGLVISGILIGLGTNLAGVGFETQAFTFLPLLNKPTVIAVAVTLASGLTGVLIKKQNFDFLDFLYSGSNDVGFSIDQQKGDWSSVAALAISFLCGALYTLGIVYAGFTNKAKVQSFFDVDNWNGDIGAAILTVLVINFIGIYFLDKNYRPEWGTRPSAGGRLWVGSALFGFGWGMTGLCIGPVYIISATCVTQILVVLLPSMILGYALEAIVDSIRRH